jgi:hypothetical protein
MNGKPNDHSHRHNQPSHRNHTWGQPPRNRISAPELHNHTWEPELHNQHRHHTWQLEPHRTALLHSRCRNRICGYSPGHNHTS